MHLRGERDFGSDAPPRARDVWAWSRRQRRAGRLRALLARPSVGTACSAPGWAPPGPSPCGGDPSLRVLWVCREECGWALTLSARNPCSQHHSHVMPAHCHIRPTRSTVLQTLSYCLHVVPRSVTPFFTSFFNKLSPYLCLDHLLPIFCFHPQF